MIKDHFQQAKIKKVPGIFKDELGGKIMIEFVALRPKTYIQMIMVTNIKNLKAQKVV